jgi:MFS family permease
MNEKFNYRHTMAACYFVNFFQAIGCVIPILLIPIRDLYGLSYTQFGVLVTVNFFTQLSSDVLFSKPVERFGFRPFAVGAPIVSCLGLVFFAASPVLLPGREFAGFCIGVFFFAASAGLQELLLSPIFDALPLPKEAKARNMSFLHSFFAWGQIFVILVTTGLVAILGKARWQTIVFGWALVPLAGAVLFALVPLWARVKAGSEMKIRSLFKNRIFLWTVAAIITGGAAEVTMSQWASAFIERGLALPKIIGDTLGVCVFSLTLALGRTLYAFFGGKISIHKMMIAGSAGAAFLYLCAALSPFPVIGLIACALTGFCVSLLWPGSVIIAAKHLPTAGASMFALLSASGDLGASMASFGAGRVADTVGALPLLGLSGEQAGLRTALLFAALFPLLSVLVNLVLKRLAGTEETTPP